MQSKMILFTFDELVPENSLYRKIDKYIDFSFIYDKVKHLYCCNNGRNSIDPVLLFKLVFIQTLDGLKSMRKNCKKIKVDLEYRCFLGIPLGVSTLHYSTFSQNYIRRFQGTEVFEEIFVEIVEQAIKYDLVKGETFFTDSTHKKADTNKHKFHQKIQEVAHQRRELLDNEVNEERKKQGYRTIRRLICEKINERARARRLSKRGKDMYKQRKEKIERSFADSKNNHGYRYAILLFNFATKKFNAYVNLLKI